MKKFFLAAIVAAAGMMTSCSNGSKADLKDDIDSLSYAIGMSEGTNMKQQLAQYMVQNGIDSTYVDEFIRGMQDAMSKADDKKQQMYYLGAMQGFQISQQMVKGLNQQIFQGDSTKTVSVKNLAAGIASGIKGQKGIFTPEKAQEFAQKKFMSVQAASMEKTYGKNRKDGEAYAAKYAKQAGVKNLGNGILYKVITEGKGAKATAESKIKVNYVGKTIDGKTFDSNEGKDPVEMTPGMVIPGFREALLNMPVGSKWEVVIPQDQAYGPQAQGPIQPLSTLVFTIEVVDIVKEAPAAAPKADGQQ